MKMNIVIFWCLMQNLANKIVNANWTINIKRWKNLTNEEKMNRLWFWFKMMIIFVVLNSIIDIFKNITMLNTLNNMPIMI